MLKTEGNWRRSQPTNVMHDFASIQQSMIVLIPHDMVMQEADVRQRLWMFGKSLAFLATESGKHLPGKGTDDFLFWQFMPAARG